jgi:hypothetical protein
VSRTCSSSVLRPAGMVGAACEPDVLLFGATTCGMLTAILSKVGAAMTVLGIRKAATAPNTT